MTPYYEDESVVIYHGDCGDVLPSLHADAVITDAPYNADFQYGAGTNDSRPWGVYTDWLVERIDLMEAAASGPVLVFVSVTGASHLWAAKPPQWTGAWVRPTAGNPVGSIHGTLILPTWEPCLFYGDLKALKCSTPDVWRTRTISERNGHPCPKPLTLMRDILGRIPAESIIDPFMGSGTTLRAAKDMGRKAVGIEIEERFCEIAARRMGQEVLDLGA